MVGIKQCDVVGDMISQDKPQIMSKIYACFCNKIANDMYPDKCDAVCPQGGMMDGSGCMCKDAQRAGAYCHQIVCKLGRKEFCKGSIIGPGYKWEVCETGVNVDRLNEIASCSCQYGTLQGDGCECNTDYTGLLCEDYIPSTIRLGGGGSGFGFNEGNSTDTSIDESTSKLPFAAFIVLVVIIALVMVVVGYIIHKRSKSTTPVTYSPAVVQGPAAFRSAYPVQQTTAHQPYPPSGQGSGQPAAVCHQPAGLTYTYTFQPAGGSSPAPHYPIASAPPPPAAYYDPSIKRDPSAAGGAPPGYNEA